MPSHPSHCTSSLPLQSDASRAQTFLTFPSAPHSANDWFTVAASGSGSVYVKRLRLPASACLVCFSTALSSFAKASEKSCTPSMRSLSVTSFMEIRLLQERLNQLVGEFDTDDTTAEHQHVHVVVPNALVRRIGVVAQSGADPGNPVCGHRRANAAPAEQDAALGPVLTQGSTHGLRRIGIVYRISAVGAQVEDLAMLRGQKSLHVLLKCKSGMIRTNRYAHRSSRFRDLLLCRCDDLLGGEAELLLQLLKRRGGAERLHTDAVTARADILRPAEG